MKLTLVNEVQVGFPMRFTLNKIIEIIYLNF